MEDVDSTCIFVQLRKGYAPDTETWKYFLQYFSVATQIIL